MNRTLHALMMAGLFVGLGTPAFAKDDPAGMQPSGAPESAATQKDPKGTKPTSPSTTDDTPSSGSKAAYNAAKDKADADYKKATALCDSMQGESMRGCMSDAKKTQTVALSKAKTQRDGQSDMSTMDGDAPAKGTSGKDAGKPSRDDMSNPAGNSKPAQ